MRSRFVTYAWLLLRNKAGGHIMAVGLRSKVCLLLVLTGLLAIRSGAQTQSPAVPIGLKALGKDSNVVLVWKASTGATSYHIKRSTTSGGPYTTVATGTCLCATNTGVTNGTTYYYVVSAVNTAGESVNSAQVSAKPVAAA
jgi:cellulose 1,4-beta-cellobiosidase